MVLVNKGLFSELVFCPPKYSSKLSISGHDKLRTHRTLSLSCMCTCAHAHTHTHTHTHTHKTSTKPKNDRKRNKLKGPDSEQKHTDSHQNSQLLGGTKTES